MMADFESKPATACAAVRMYPGTGMAICNEAA
jgi:hypothetical protein